MSQDLDRVYTIPLGKALLSPDNHRAKRAINMIREFARRHMKIKDVRIDPEVAKLVWARGMRRPPRKIRVRMERTEEKHILITRYDERDAVAGTDAGAAPESPDAGAEPAAAAAPGAVAAGAAVAADGSDVASVSGPEAAGAGIAGPPALEGTVADASVADASAAGDAAAAAPDRIEAREVTADADAEDAGTGSLEAGAPPTEAAGAADAGGNDDKPDAANAPDGAADDAAAGADNAGDSGGGGAGNDAGNDAAADADGDKKPGD